MGKKFTLGIDLGTSNSALTVTDLDTDESRVVGITQLFGPKRVGELDTLPSALYIPNGAEFSEEEIRLPWGTSEEGIIGRFARDHGSLIADRLVTSAKSWLSNPHIDPRSNVLPWGSRIEEGKLSPFACSKAYLEHLINGFLYAESLEGRSWNLDDCQIVLTVPASFDETARSLTLQAAEAAGLKDVVLLEEPQAAFYAWAERAGGDWRKEVSPGDIILVCDVGGGTSDFSLIAVSETDGELALERISVGEHILLGGDNMDLGLAYAVQAKIEEAGSELDEWQFLSLVHAVSRAKIQLFSDESLQEVPVSIPSRGSSLFAGTIASSLDRDVLNSIVLDGFFAQTAVSEFPEESPGSALQEFGLPYATDAVVSKHLARFLSRSLQNVRGSESLSALLSKEPAQLEGSILKPTAILFNGGVFKAEAVRRRVVDLLASWGSQTRELEGFQPDLAVSKGAAFYGRNRVKGSGLRIRAGTARSYYLGLESARPAVPGIKLPVKALCVVPQGMEEGSDHLLEDRQFGLVTGKPAVFRFFSSEIRGGDTPGDVIPNAEKELEETGKIEVALPPMDEFPVGQPIPVHLHAVVTELGNLELWMKHTASDKRWKVDFKVRME